MVVLFLFPLRERYLTTSFFQQLRMSRNFYLTSIPHTLVKTPCSSHSATSQYCTLSSCHHCCQSPSSLYWGPEMPSFSFISLAKSLSLFIIKSRRVSRYPTRYPPRAIVTNYRKGAGSLKITQIYSLSVWEARSLKSGWRGHRPRAGPREAPFLPLPGAVGPGSSLAGQQPPDPASAPRGLLFSVCPF